VIMTLLHPFREQRVGLWAEVSDTLIDG